MVYRLKQACWVDDLMWGKSIVFFIVYLAGDSTPPSSSVSSPPLPHDNLETRLLPITTFMLQLWVALHIARGVAHRMSLGSHN